MFAQTNFIAETVTEAIWWCLLVSGKQWWQCHATDRRSTRASLVTERSCGNALVISKSALNRSPILLLRERSRHTNGYATRTSVLAAILSDISDGGDTNLIYILLASECQQRNNEDHFKTKVTKHQTKSQFVYKKNSCVTWLKLLGSKFFDPK